MMQTLAVFVIAISSIHMIRGYEYDEDLLYDRMALPNINYYTSTDLDTFPTPQYGVDRKPKNQPCQIPDRTDGNKISLNLKMCHYRGRNFPEIIYKWYTGHGCYVFSQPALFAPDSPNATISSCIYEDFFNVPCFLIPIYNQMLCYPIDPRIPEVIKEVERTMGYKQSAEKWKRCTDAAMDCCKNVMNEENIKPDEERCTAIWDGWHCWNPAKAGDVIEDVCPEFAYSNKGPDCHHFGSKTCYNNASWEMTTDYKTCSVNERLLQRLKIHVILLMITVVQAIPAIAVLLAYRRLRIRRLALHRNLLIAITLRSIFVIITKKMIIENELITKEGPTHMELNMFPCKLLAVMEKLAASTVFSCMLVDGIFMHRRIVAVFKKELNIVVVNIVVAVITVIPIIIWSVLMGVFNDSNCWIVYTMPGVQWALDAPRILMLLINTVLLIDIMRIILTKMKNKDSTNQLSTAKATLFLMPLFGVQFLLTAWRPKFSSCVWEQWYYILAYVLESLQGCMVAILYCYANKEVYKLIKLTYKKTENVVSTRFNKSTVGRRWTKANLRRGTLSTSVAEDVTQVSEPTPEPQHSVNFDKKNKTEPDMKIFGSFYYSSSADGLVGLDFEDDANERQYAPDDGTEDGIYSIQNNNNTNCFIHLTDDLITSTKF